MLRSTEKDAFYDCSSLKLAVSCGKNLMELFKALSVLLPTTKGPYAAYKLHWILFFYVIFLLHSMELVR